MRYGNGSEYNTSRIDYNIYSTIQVVKLQYTAIIHTKRLV